MKIQALSGETAIAQRFRPCSVFGPVDLPPWKVPFRSLALRRSVDDNFRYFLDLSSV
jgi:hypothetical protein